MFAFMLVTLSLAAADGAAPISIKDAAVKPKLVSEATPSDVSEARALGHNGTTVLSATVNTDGSVGDIKVTESSQSQLLDEAAKAQVARAKFEPARDAAGKPVAVTFGTRISYQGDAQNDDGWIARYRCGQLVKDLAWWRSTHVGKTDTDYPLYSIILGAAVLSDPKGMAEGLKRSVATTQKEWAAAQVKCASHPDALMIDYLSTGPLFRRLARIK